MTSQIRRHQSKNYASGARSVEPFVNNVIVLATTDSLAPAKDYLKHYRKVVALEAAAHNDS
jgi:hypothetical protein